MISWLICKFKGHQFGHVIDTRTWKPFAQSEPIPRATIVICIKCKRPELIDNPWYKPAEEERG